MLGPMGGTGVVTLIPALSTLHDVSVGAMGLAITVYMVPFAALQLLSGSVSQLFTGRRTALAGFAVYGGASLGCALAPGLPLFIACRFVQGVGAAFLFPVLMALVGEVVAPARLGRAIGAFNMTQTVGLTAGPLLAGLAQTHLGWRWFFALLALWSVAAAAGFVGLFREEPPPRPGEGSVLAISVRALREPAAILLSVAAAGVFFSMIGSATYLAAWLKAGPGLTEDRIGVVLAIFGAVGVPASVLAGRWVDRVGRRSVGVWGLAGHVAALLALAWAPYAFWRVLVLAGLLGWTAAVAWTALNTLAVEISPQRRKPVAAIYNAFRFTGYALAPPLLGIVYARVGIAAVFLAAALAAALAGLLVGTCRLPAASRGG